MKSILPRLKNLLGILADEPEPVPINAMANRLRVSRRTVFRELANVESLLRPYGLDLGSKPGEGLVLEGPDAGRERLRRDLTAMGGDEPADRDERRLRLALALLQRPGQKLLSYADRFKVSAATVSHDLDEIDARLIAPRLQLHRRSGFGISLEGDETAKRRVMLTVMSRLSAEGATPPEYPSPDIAADLAGMAEELEPFLNWLAPTSRQAFERYMIVMVQRVMDGNTLERCDAETGKAFSQQAAAVATILRDSFGIDIPAAEENALALEMAGGRAKREAEPRTPAGESRLLSLVYQMIERFSPEQSVLLKLDDLLVSGLLAHLRSAVVRLRHRVELSDPLLDEMLQSYPDVMEKSRRAAEILCAGDRWLPDDEVSFLAAHFGAALLRLAEKGFRQRRVRIGVICIHGIGTSYLLASQMKKHFAGRAEIEVGWQGDREELRHFDFLVSTTPLPDWELPVVVVRPFLGDEEVARIGKEIARHAASAAPRTKSGAGFAHCCHTLAVLCGDAGRLVENFKAQRVDAATGFEELAKLAGYRFGDTENDGRRIFDGLLAREELSSQVIPELGVVLLHCRSDGVRHPAFGLIVPDGERFADPYFYGAQACIVMLVPEKASREQLEMLGELSAALIRDEEFLLAVRNGAADSVKTHLEDLLRGFILRHTNQTMKGQPWNC